jgi:arylsulfatase A-like enzyme
MSSTEVSSTRSQRFGLVSRLVRWAIWFGILTGYLELLNLGFRRYAVGSLILLGRHTLWMAPLADAALFLVLGAALVPIAICRPTRAVERLATWGFAFTAAASLILLHGEIHNLAAALLSAGVAVQATRFVAARVEGFDRLVRRTLPWMAAACIGAAVALPAWWAWDEHRAIEALPRVAEGSPNVLLVVWDTVRANSLSTYGYRRDTSPNLTRVGGEGVVFERAIAPSPWTLPSHASFFTGRWAHELTANWDVPFDDAHPTLAEALGARGYVTAGFVANQHYCSQVHGLNRGFVHYEDFNPSWSEFVLSSQIGRRLTTSPRLRRWTGFKDVWGRKSAEQINADFLRWLDVRPSRPFFAFLNYYDAHLPYHAPPTFDEGFGSNDWMKGFPFCAQLRYSYVLDPDSLAPGQRRAEHDAYDRSIAYLDACLGRLTAAMERRGILDDTLVIVLSDHGEHFGEHGLREHGNSLYRPLLHVPLVVRYPSRVPSGPRPPQVVSLRDLPATVLDLLGCTGPFELPGTSLRRYWDGSEPEEPAPPLFASLRPSAGYDAPHLHLDGVIAEGKHYIRSGEGGEELYDFDHDPLEQRDLSSVKGMQETVAWLRAMAVTASNEIGE